VTQFLAHWGGTQPPALAQTAPVRTPLALTGFSAGEKRHRPVPPALMRERAFQPAGVDDMRAFLLCCCVIAAWWEGPSSTHCAVDYRDVID
jgi:hypothetical protein